ncbi:MAG: DUF5117 domain-containing protein [Candidatus Latescibacteria bacterium]|nr:DUF5117 domain-containing protein [Candidatus Latescibacterota bacterium]
MSIIILGLTLPLYAQDEQPKPTATDSAAVAKSDSTTKGTEEKEEDKKKTIEDLTKSSQAFKGLFTVFQDTTTGDLQLLIKENQIGKEYIYFTQTLDGVLAAGHFRGNFRDNRVFSIQKHFDRIEIISENTSYYFAPNNALSKAARANISPSILISAKIEAHDDSTQTYLIKANGIFHSEALHRVNRTQGSKGFALGKLSKEKTKTRAIKNYPKNTDLIVAYTYENPNPKGGGAGITDARNVTITLRHTLIKMPKNDYQPRFDDPRVGYFTTKVTDLTSTSATPYRDLVHRWHLKKKDPKAKLSNPVTPITWWIENTTPKELRSTIKKAALNWNIAFEAAGFKNAVQVKEQPDDATWDAGDIRYNVLRWTSSPQPPFGGYGPSFVNPRTGEIMGADVMLEFGFITNRLTRGRVFETAALHLEEQLDTQDPRLCSLGHALHESGLFGIQALRVSGASKLQMEDLLKDSLHYLILHEIGHTLGLNHNMKASQMQSLDNLHNKSLTSKLGLTGSVMDYPSINFALPNQKQGEYYTTRPGPYDLWAIEFGYSSTAKNNKAEQDRLDRILARSTEPELMFGNDADDMRSANRGIDPRVMIYDLSGDAIGQAMGRIELANSIMNQVQSKYNTQGNTYQELQDAYIILTGQQGIAGTIISRYIGGVYMDRAVIGQPGATQPLLPVALADQKRAMDALTKHIFASNAYDTPNGLYNHLQQQRRGFSNTDAPKIHGRILNIHKSILDYLLHRRVQTRIVDSALYGNEYALSDMMTDLTDAVFKSDIAGTVNSFRQNLQIEYVQRLSKMTTPDNNHIYASRAIALDKLKNIQTQLKDKKTTDTSTQAHTGYILHLIEQATDND